eukprot:4697306-Amphidinium_carterae.1
MDRDMVATAFRVVAAALLAFPSVSAFAGQARTNDTPLTKVHRLQQSSTTLAIAVIVQSLQKLLPTSTSGFRLKSTTN